MRYFPLYIDTSNLSVLLVGAGEVAARKLDLLARTDADIHVVAPQVCDDIADYADSGRIELSGREVVSTDLQDVDLVYIATADNLLNQQLAELAREEGALVNVVDDPDNCDFITPSIVDRGRLVVAVSTAGAAPVFAKDIRGKLEALLPQSLSPLMDFIAEKRHEVQQKHFNPSQRRHFWERFLRNNGERYDSHTITRYQQCFTEEDAFGELLLLQQDVMPKLLPIAIIPWLQRVDLVLQDEVPAQALVELIRRDASRSFEPMADSELLTCWEQGQWVLRITNETEIKRLKAAFPFAKHLRPGAI
ncbi:bifunctional precorrin-2 dehydrogenase/sirohydrochlorin ferrochelatase [Shewanella sp. A32]|uniref:precorrin-2 dehydrogenase/sirohydrochlorin ferrochelatase family protein n=1 Tax=Shewanella sp. A32 TaxID=3031327 RepID=UPI0023B9D094|nr:bifunctional precorrin-2 dehydrogenase/sirohydrochlorin ferrochelatase [Shewanella sp. A32]MDF0534229.1 bifunctional precorrin-2 dehydrogenase/sirohydrochlorin ferrochelatase [Shewanella sp. A32]